MLLWTGFLHIFREMLMVLQNLMVLLAMNMPTQERVNTRIGELLCSIMAKMRL